MTLEKAWKNKTAWKLYRENWLLCRKIVEVRDGYACQIPGCGQREALQLDHVFSRTVKTLFFETGNLGYLCGPHHQHKSFRHGQWVDLTVKDICRVRQGEAWWDYAMMISRNHCRDFRKVWYQEMIHDSLVNELEELMAPK